MSHSCTGDASGGGFLSDTLGRSQKSQDVSFTNEVLSYAGLVVIWMGH